MEETALLVLAGGFAFVTGMNDGGSVTSAGVKLPGLAPLTAIGAITGAGLGAGLLASWGWVVWVVVLAAVAPLVGALLAQATTWFLHRVGLSVPARITLQRAHRVSFVLVCLAYGINDGQKVLAVFALALVLSTAPVELSIGMLLLLGACFAVGAVVGLRRYGGMLGDGIMIVRPVNAMVAEFAAGVSVIVTGVLGEPVSRTQAVAGGLIGSGAQESTRRIRWNRALMFAVAWVVTLPLAMLAATAITALVVRVMTPAG